MEIHFKTSVQYRTVCSVLQKTFRLSALFFIDKEGKNTY